MNRKKPHTLNRSAIAVSQESAKENIPSSGGFFSKLIYEDLLRIRSRKGSVRTQPITLRRRPVPTAPATELCSSKGISHPIAHISAPQELLRERTSLENCGGMRSSSFSRYLVPNLQSAQSRKQVDMSAVEEEDNISAPEKGDISTILREKDEHINVLRQLLAKAIKILSNMQTSPGGEISFSAATVPGPPQQQAEIRDFLESVHEYSESSFIDPQLLGQSNGGEQESSQRRSRAKSAQRKRPAVSHMEKIAPQSVCTRKSRADAGKGEKMFKSCMEGTGGRTRSASNRSNCTKRAVGKNLNSVEVALKSFLGGFRSIKEELSQLGEVIGGMDSRRAADVGAALSEVSSVSLC